MVIALFALAFAMIVGGLFATILGWDIVLVERGWTMVIAGTVSAASGALLLGVTAIVSKLSRIHAELTRLQANLVEEEAEEAAGMLPAAAGVSVAALAGGLFGRRAPEETPPAGLPKEPDVVPPLFTEAEPRLEQEREEEREDMSSPAPREMPAPEEPFGAGRPSYEPERFPEPEIAAAEEPSRRDEAAEEAPRVKLPDFLFVERFRRTTYTEVPAPEPEREDEPFPHAREAEEAPGHEPERDIFAAAPEPAPVAEEEPAEPEPVREQAAEPEAEAAVEPQAEEGIASVIGSYTSGENRYVMYSDGSIEAETPRGVFKFQSLDELKAFIATGEGGTRLT